MRRHAAAMASAAVVALWAAAATALPPFPHALHIEDEGIECADCHPAASTSTRSADQLLPPDPDLCLDCHDEGDVRMTWSVARRDVDFSHAGHVSRLHLDCARCHQGLTVLPVSPAGYLPSMDACMTCHNGDAAPRDCETCHHADRAALVPASHTPFWKQDHGPASRLANAECLPCHAVSDCQECHENTLLVEQMQLGAAAQTPFAPRLEGTSGTVVQAVHGLNWRFLHGLEARGKASDCLTCHELDSGDFCAECHNPAGSVGIRPAWHGGGGWTTLGVGSGGGRHAELARQDIETCAACHDNSGDDPICLECHMDRTPGRGNDPRTHASGFAGDMGHGGFHDDDGAVCFTCHTVSRQADGFCTYCHEPR